MSKIDWQNLIVLGLHKLELSPDVFWDLTPAELLVKAGGAPLAQTCMSRNVLQDLIKKFPDK